MRDGCFIGIREKNPTKWNSGTFWTRCWGSQKSDAGRSGFCPAAHRTAAWWQTSCPPLWGAAGPWERHPAALWSAPAPAAPWRTASLDRPHHRGVRWTGTPHQRLVLPEQTKQFCCVRPFWGSRALSEFKVHFSHHSPWALSGEWQSQIFWTGPQCRRVPAVSCMRRPES